MKVEVVDGGGILVELECPGQPLSIRGARILASHLQSAIEDVERMTNQCREKRHMECENIYCRCRCHD